jgi:hypothetical protein
MPSYRAIYPFACAAFAAAALPSVAQGQWVVDGTPVCSASGVQLRTGIVSDGNGGAVVFWVDGRDLRRDLYAHRVMSEGKIAPGWPQNGVFLATGLGEAWSPVGTSDGSGGAIIVWEDAQDFSATHHNIFAQRVTGDGAVAPGWPAGGLPVCTAPGDQRAPRIISDGAGGAIVTWYDCRSDPNAEPLPLPDIYAQRVMTDGTIAPGWPVNGAAICTTPEQQYDPTLAPDGAGGAIISWSDGRNLNTTGADIYAQRITSSGEIAPSWPQDGVPLCGAAGNEQRPRTVSDGQGGAIAIWMDGRGGSDDDFDVYAQRIMGTGVVAPGWPQDGVPLCRAPRTQQSLSAAADGLGGAIVTWEDYRSHASGTNTASDIYAQRVTGQGVIPPGWPPDGMPVCVAPSFQLNPQLAPDGADGAFIVWEDTRSGTNEDVYAQHVTAFGAVALGWEPDGLPVCTRPASQPTPVVVSDGMGEAITAWSDVRNGNKDIFAHKLGVDGPVPALLSLLSAEAGTHRVVLTWYGTDAASLAAIVQRRTESTEWEVLGSTVSEGPDLMRYEDRSIVPGTRYAYRLAYRDEGAERFTAETWVEIPALALSLAGFRPNPAIGTATLAFSLPDDRPARLDVIDVKGRVVHSRDVGSLGGGAHVLPFAGRTPLPPGMYWIRLTHPERTLTTKGLVVR